MVHDSLDLSWMKLYLAIVLASIDRWIQKRKPFSQFYFVLFASILTWSKANFSWRKSLLFHQSAICNPNGKFLFNLNDKFSRLRQPRFVHGSICRYMARCLPYLNSFDFLDKKKLTNEILFYIVIHICYILQMSCLHKIQIVESKNILDSLNFQKS